MLKSYIRRRDVARSKQLGFPRSRTKTAAIRETVAALKEPAGWSDTPFPGPGSQQEAPARTGDHPAGFADLSVVGGVLEKNAAARTWVTAPARWIQAQAEAGFQGACFG